MNSNSKQIIYENLLLNQEVFDSIKGEGIIKSLNWSKGFPILVKFKDGHCATYTKDGKHSFIDKFPALFTSSPFSSQDEQPEFPKIMEVSDNKRKWLKRVIFAKNQMYYIAWEKATSLEEITRTERAEYWLHAREIKKEEVEISKKELEFIKKVSKIYNIPIDELKFLMK